MTLTPEQSRRFCELSVEAKMIDPATAGPEEVARLAAIVEEMNEILPLPPRRPEYHMTGRAVDVPVPSHPLVRRRGSMSDHAPKIEP